MAGPTSNPDIAATSVSDRRPALLVVDDSPLDRSMAAGILRNKVAAHVIHAEHGLHALELIAQQQPDAILTDVQMPHLDGLGLLERVQQDYPGIPTVVMTSHGSEETAMLALQRGAVSYVPKRFLAEHLADVIQQVLGATAADGGQIRLKEFWQHSEHYFELNNDDSLIPALVSHLQHVASRVCRLDEAEKMRAGVALHEALRNAMHHGNLELSSELRRENPQKYYETASIRRQTWPYKPRRVYVRAYESPGQSKYVIADEGQGFDPTAVNYDPENPADLAKNSGRGLFLIKTFMSEVTFNNKGNEITMIHRRKQSTSDAVAQSGIAEL